MMQIPDPIHGYIELDGMFADIVNTPEFQRLRSVTQGSFSPVFPSARHDRFAHSLGTYHLATKFVEHFFENLKKDAGITVKKAEREKLSRTFRYAALLHDIGHAPFSHTTESFFEEKKDAKDIPMIWHDLCKAVGKADRAEGELFSDRGKKCGAAHEIMSATILVEQWKTFHRKNKKGKYVLAVDLPLAARMVIGFTYSPGDIKDLKGQDVISLGVRNCLIQMLNYSVLDVDRLDYMLRDTQMSGYVNAPLDLACLAQSVSAVKVSDAWALWKAKKLLRLDGEPLLKLCKNTAAFLPKGHRLTLTGENLLENDEGTVSAPEEQGVYTLKEDVSGFVLKKDQYVKLLNNACVAVCEEIRVKLPKGTLIEEKREEQKIVWKLAEAMEMKLAAGDCVCPDDVVEVVLQGSAEEPMQLRPSWLVNAYRDEALRVFDLMFQAKLSHDAWVLAVPAGAYDAALLAHCIRKLNEKIDKEYMETIFTAKALSREGVTLKGTGNHYQFLSDVDVAADLKAQTHPKAQSDPKTPTDLLFEELFTREISKRRIAAWRSYYEYHHVFNCPEKGLSPEKVYGFFKPLMEYMSNAHMLVFDKTAYQTITDDKEAKAEAKRAANLLKEFLMHAHTKRKADPEYNVVLLDRTNNFTLKLDPTKIFIVFPKLENGNKRLPLRRGKYNYSTYAELTCDAHRVNYKADYFYIMRHDGLGCRQLEKLRVLLAKALNK